MGLDNVLTMAENAATGGIIGIGTGLIGNAMQARQQEKLQELQIRGQKEMTDYNARKQLEMWNATGYVGQVKQMDEAGINSALLYGNGGGGGSTAITGGNVGSASAEGGAKAVQGGMEIGMQMKAQTELLQAQKENVEADTANKRSQVPVNDTQVPINKAKVPEIEANVRNKDMDTTKKEEEQWGIGLDNAMKQWLQTTDENGEDTEIGKLAQSVAGKHAIAELNKTQAEGNFKIDENTRQNIMNNAQVQKITAEISLMKKQGMTQDQILKNLIKDGIMKQTEIEWNKLGLTKETLGQMVLGLLKHATK